MKSVASRELISKLLFLLLAAAFFGPSPAAGEKFLSIEEAQRVCFPEADRFEERRIVFDKKEYAVFTAKKGEVIAGYFLFDQVIGKHDFIDYAVALSPDGAVRQVEILEYREHYGGQVSRAEWRSQFAGKTGQSPLKLFGDISNISGATLSCRHVTQGVRKCLAVYELFLKEKS